MYDIMFFGARSGCIPSGDEQKSWVAHSWRGPIRISSHVLGGERGLPVLGEAPFVHYITRFGARLGCIPSADEQKIKKDVCPFLERPHSCII